MSKTLTSIVLFLVLHSWPATGGELPPLTTHYALTLHLRLEAQAAQTVSIGNKEYLQPTATTLDATARFKIVQKLWPAAEGGKQNREVDVEEVETERVRASVENESARLLRASLEDILRGWKQVEGQTLRSSRLAGSHAWSPAIRLTLEEEAPPFLTVWLDEALQTLPLATVPVAERAWNRENSGLEAEERKAGSETVREETVGGEPAEVQVTTLSLSGRKSAAEILPALRQQGVEVVLSFHAEEQDTVSLEDGRLLRAVREASRETSWILPQKVASAAPFRSRLACTVTITELQ